MTADRSFLRVVADPARRRGIVPERGTPAGGVRTTAGEPSRRNDT